MIPAVGYRLWRVDPADGWLAGRLQSLVAETLWPTRERLQSVCEGHLAPARSLWRLHELDRGTPRGAPLPECTCGIYAYHEIRPMLREISITVRDEPLRLGGAVLCWGRIVIHPEGIRAEYARPLALCLPPALPVTAWAEARVHEVARAYAVPVLAPEPMIRYAQEFGASYKPDLEKKRAFHKLRRTMAGLRRLLGV